jgi:hypothetical protein
MESTDTLLSNELSLEIGDSASPPTYSLLCAAASRGEIGEEAPLVEVTGLCDDVKAYIAGLPDGAEFPITVNYRRTPADGVDPGLTDLYEAYKSKRVVPVRIGIKGVSPYEGFDFDAIVRSWNIAGGEPGNPAQLQFTLKIVTPIVWSYS